jgi:hypothetical protein
MKLTIQATMSVRANFAAHHLRAAAQAARSAYDIEQSGAVKTLGPGFDQTVSIVMAGAALEANANELIQDILDGPTTISLTAARKMLLKELKEERSGNALDRYRSLVMLLDRIPDEGRQPWQDTTTLVSFRNYFLHFKPVWDPGDGSHERKLAAALKSKFDLARPYKNVQFMFPHALLTYECAKWSVQTILAFSKSISDILGVTDRFANWQPTTALP